MKLYKISGSSEYVDWDILHNQQGYSTSATNPVTWKSSLGNTWGETVANGYMEPTAASGWATKGFCLGKRGWHNMDDMANIYYVWPDVATSAKARHATWGESDVAVWDYDGTHTLYLVQKELEEGWMDEDTFAERGWEIVPDMPLGELVFVDASGAVVYSVERLNEMVFAPTGYFTIEDDGEVLFVEQSPYPTVCQHSETRYGEVQADAGVTLALPYYTQKLYLYEVVAVGGNVTSGWEIVNDSGFVKVVNRTGAAVTAVVFVISLIDATDASIVDVEYISTGFRASAFKWSGGGMDYYFIPFYEEATGWTDDLSAIGWQEVPSVVLPTVTRQWLYATSSVTTIDLYAGESSGNIYELVGSSYVAKQVNPSVLQCVFGWRGTSASDYGFGTFETMTTGTGGYVWAKNITSSRIAGIFYFRYAECSDPTATVVTVYNSSNVAYNAFKYTASGTDYHYVLDGTQTDWTDDLSSIGYEEVPAVVLPTVSVGGDWGSDNWLYANTGGNNVSVLAGNSVLIGTGGSSSPTPVDYDTTKSYSVIRWATYQSAQGSGYTEYAIVNNSGKIYAKNVTSGDLYLYSMRVAVCSDSTAIVVTVYDSSNNPFNAFLYTINNTDYYYVLDGTQADWTDDLSSIGYRVEDYIDIFAFGQTGTFSRQGGVTSSFSGTVDSLCIIKLYDGPNLVTPMPFDSTVRYDVGYYDNGNWIPDAVQSLAEMPATTSSPYVTAGLAIDYSGQLSIWEVRNQTGTGSVNISWNNWQIRAYSEAYTTWNLPRQTAYFTNSGSAGTTNTEVSPSQGGNGYLLYDASGNQIPYDSSKTYKFLRGFDVSGGGVPFAGRLYFDGGGGYLRLYSYGWNWSTYVFRIEYSVT